MESVLEALYNGNIDEYLIAEEGFFSRIKSNIDKLKQISKSAKTNFRNGEEAAYQYYAYAKLYDVDMPNDRRFLLLPEREQKKIREKYHNVLTTIYSTWKDDKDFIRILGLEK